MDFHFYGAKEATTPKSNLRKTIISFLPLFVLAAILPLAVTLIRRPTSERFNAGASNNELTVWFAPSSVEVTHGHDVTLSVYANFDSNEFLPGVTFPVSVEGPASIRQAQISYIKPFSGKVMLGSVTVLPYKVGVVRVGADFRQIVSPTFNGTFSKSVSIASITVK